MILMLAHSTPTLSSPALECLSGRQRKTLWSLINTRMRALSSWYLIGHWACCHLRGGLLHTQSSVLAEMHFLLSGEGEL